MTYVFSTEIGTVLAASNRPSFAGIISQPELMQAAGCQPPCLGMYLPTEVLGRVWNVTAHRMPALFAFAVGEEHSDTPVVYGRWGQAMDHAPTVRDRLVAGARLLYVHTDAPRWSLRPKGDAFDFARMWRYTNTSCRGEAFATISDMHEWLIVMQRGVAEPIRPLSIALASALYSALGRDEIRALEGAFGCRITSANESSLRFEPKDLRHRPVGGSRTDFTTMARHLTMSEPPSVTPLLDPSMLAYITQLAYRGERAEKIAASLGMPLDRFLSLFLFATGVHPWSFWSDNTAQSRWLHDLDSRHRKALGHAAQAAAEYISDMHRPGLILKGLDIGGGELDVTEIFLRRLIDLTGAEIGIDVVDPVLSRADEMISRRMDRMTGELGADVTLRPMWWNDFVEAAPSDAQYDFAIGFQLLSLMNDASIRFLFGSLRRFLRPGGRFFAAVEPFDRATLPRYKARGYKFYSRPVHWYHEMARQSGLSSKPSGLMPAHRGDERSMMLNLLIEK